MTPFGQAVRRLRKINKITLKHFAQEMGVSSAYFSALEHGYRGRPGPGLVQQIAGYFNLGMEGNSLVQRRQTNASSSTWPLGVTIEGGTTADIGPPTPRMSRPGSRTTLLMQARKLEEDMNSNQRLGYR